MNMASKGESPRERHADAHAQAHATQKKKTFKICKRSHAIFDISFIFAALQETSGCPR
jgi:hypothetical protein